MLKGWRWHAFPRDLTVLPAHPAFIRERNKPYLPLPSQPKLVLIYRLQRDGWKVELDLDLYLYLYLYICIYIYLYLGKLNKDKRTIYFTVYVSPGVCLSVILSFFISVIRKNCWSHESLDENVSRIRSPDCCTRFLWQASLGPVEFQLHGTDNFSVQYYTNTVASLEGPGGGRTSRGWQPTEIFYGWI